MLLQELFAAVALAAGAAAAKAIQVGLEFDKSMTKIITLVGIAEDKVDSMRQSYTESSSGSWKDWSRSR